MYIEIFNIHLCIFANFFSFCIGDYSYDKRYEEVKLHKAQSQ